MHAKKQQSVQSTNGVQMMIRDRAFCNITCCFTKKGVQMMGQTPYRTDSSLDMAEVTIIYLVKME